MNLFRLLLSFILTLILTTTITISGQRVKAYSTCEKSTFIIHSPEILEKISYWTDYFFYLVRPEMESKKIKFSETIYRREKIAIRQVIREVLLCTCESTVYKKNQDGSNQNYYLRNQEDNYFFAGFYRELTDAVFYARHPELSDRKSWSKDMNLATEWMFIRQYFTSFNTSERLQKEFIPTCNKQ
jgi:hypothetical protein